MNLETRDPFETYSGNIEDYYMVDYQVVEHPQWVRKPFVHKEDLTKVLIYELRLHLSNIKNIRVLPEKWLSEMRKGEWCEEEQSYKEDTITNREFIFGYRYKEIAECIMGEGKFKKELTTSN